jgi:uncharacterized protein (TIGR03083 family)
MLHLMRHVGRSNRWAAQLIRTRDEIDLDPKTVPNGRPPDDREGARAWLLNSPQVLLEAIDEIGGLDVPVTTFDGRRPAQWWIRRLLHETTVHRADAVLAVMEDYELQSDVAADGVDEWLDRLTDMSWRRDLPIDNGEGLTVIAEDVNARWTMRRCGKSLQLSRNTTDAPSDVQLCGPAVELLLILMRRRAVEDTGCRVEGDLHSLVTFLGRTPYAALGTE